MSNVPKLRACLLTLVSRRWNYNFGAFLQAYATQVILEKMGVESQILDYVRESKGLSDTKNNFKKLIKLKSIPEIYMRIGHTLNLRLFNLKHKRKNRIRSKSFQVFALENLKFTDKTYYGIGDIENDLDYFKNNFDVFIIGSDQVWNPNNPDIDIYLLNFIESKTKISYASSVGDPIPENLFSIYKKSLPHFRAISVREKTSKEYIQKATDLEPEVVLDPLLLLDKAELEELGRSPSENITKQYLFVYDLYRPKKIIAVAQKIAKKNGWKIINHTPINSLDRLRFPLIEFSFYTKSPLEFVWLIKNADYVISSSFHGVALAVQFEKPFYAVLPAIKNKNLGYMSNSRILDFLELVGLKDRAVAYPEDLLKKEFTNNIDWVNVHQKIEREKKRSLDFLKSALGSN